MTPDEKQHMCAVVANAGLASSGLDDDDLEKLWAAKYRTAERLRAATREGLIEAHLAPGAVDAIRLALGTAVTGGLAAAVVLDEDAMCFFAMLRIGMAVPGAGDLLSVGSGNVFFPLHMRKRLWQLYVRKCYPDLFKVIYESSNYMHVVTGTPGIGKSLFFYYMVLRLLQSPSPPPFILWEHHASPGEMWCYTHASGQVRLGNRQNYWRELRNPDAWYFADGVPPDHLKKAHTVLLTSPKRETFKAMEKDGAVMLYMPLWAYDEVLDCHSKMYSSVPEATVQDLYSRYGGVARYVLEHPSLHPSMELPVLLEPLLSAIHGCSVLQVQLAICAIEMGPEASHRLLHINADDNFKKQCIMFASQWAAEEFAKRAWIMEKQQLLTILKSSDGSVRGSIYEAVMHGVLAMGGTFDVVRLDSKTLERGAEEKLDLQPSKDVRSCEDFSGMTAAGNIYLRPKSLNFPAIHAIKVPEMYLFQMTVAIPKHINADNLEEAFKRLGNLSQGHPKPSLYFVVPPDIYDTFKVQPGEKTSGRGGKTEKAAWPPHKNQVHSANTQLYILCGTYLH